MLGFLDTAGERVAIECSLPWIADLIAEGCAGELGGGGERDGVSVHVRVESYRQPFATQGWELLTRGAWRRRGELVVENACTAGFDVHVRCTDELLELTYRWRPPARDRAAARALRSRFHLLARAVLMQYPALWRAGTRGRAPLHASACTAGEVTPLLSGPSGVGRSTLVLEELRRGGRATGDNVAVGDGTVVWGLTEPLRVEGGRGRRMPHGRHEAPMPGRVEALAPDRVVVLARGSSDEPSLRSCSAAAAAHSLVTSTYMAGELRRYWAFAATLSAGTGVGPAHPAVGDVASTFARSLPCYELLLASTPAGSLSELLTAPDRLEVLA